jgi:hypothetical protein
VIKTFSSGVGTENPAILRVLGFLIGIDSLEGVNGVPVSRSK